MEHSCDVTSKTGCYCTAYVSPRILRSLMNWVTVIQVILFREWKLWPFPGAFHYRGFSRPTSQLCVPCTPSPWAVFNICVAFYYCLVSFSAHFNKYDFDCLWVCPRSDRPSVSNVTCWVFIQSPHLTWESSTGSVYPQWMDVSIAQHCTAWPFHHIWINSCGLSVYV